MSGNTIRPPAYSNSQYNENLSGIPTKNDNASHTASNPNAEPSSSKTYHANQAQQSKSSMSKFPEITNAYKKSSLVDATVREKIAGDVYKDSIVYHATEKKNIPSIREHGMVTSKKTSGATAKLSEKTTMDHSFVTTSRNHNYAMTDKSAAENFKYFENPGMIRILRNNIDFGMDPHLRDGKALRTSQEISSSNILGSKHATAGNAESQIMQNELLNRNVRVTQQEAGRLLREVQSDSEDDFK